MPNKEVTAIGDAVDYTAISIARFLAPDGSPTCCADYSVGQTCRFLGVRSFGMRDVCMLGQQRDLRRKIIFRLRGLGGFA